MSPATSSSLSVSVAPSVADCLLSLQARPRGGDQGRGSDSSSPSSVHARSSPRTDVKEGRGGRGEKRNSSRCASYPRPSSSFSLCKECCVLLTAMERTDPLSYATIRRQNKRTSTRECDVMAMMHVSLGERHALATRMSKREVLEQRYGGTVVANAAAAVIQRWYRASRLQRSFSRLMELAMSTDRLDRRLSLLGPDLEEVAGGATTSTSTLERFQNSSFKPAQQLRNVEEDIDRLILEAAGLMQNCSGGSSSGNGPSARHIRNRRSGQQNLRRSLSTKEEKGVQPQQEAAPSLKSPQHQDSSRSRDDLDLPPSPVPPCPPLRGEVLYRRGHQQSGPDPIYVTRDALYSGHQQQQEQQQTGAVQCQLNQQQDVRLFQQSVQQRQQQQQQSLRFRTQTLPPRPPQRTVSFLTNTTLPRKMSQVKTYYQLSFQEQEKEQHRSQQTRIHSDSNLHLPAPNKASTATQQQRRQQHPQQQASPNLDCLHGRSYSSPAPLSASGHQQHELSLDVGNTTGEPDEPLLPPPYISPPTYRIRSEVDSALPSSAAGLPPPPAPSDLFLPPPPPDVRQQQQRQQQQPRPPCDSASSSSSIDSGYGRSSVSDGGARCANGAALASPGATDCVFEPRPHFNHLMPRQQQQQQQLTVVSLTQNLVQRNATAHINHVVNQDGGSPKVKKMVRIQTPDQEAIQEEEQEETRQNLENQKQLQMHCQARQHQQQNQTSSSLVEEDVFRRRQYRNADLGMEYLLKRGFLDYSPVAAGHFLKGRKGLSRQAVGEYLTDLRRPFNLAALHCFIHELDFTGLHLDIALRQLQEELTMPGEAQKIEKVVEVFSKRYIQCNQMFVSSFRSPDTIFVLSYAVVLLNTDLHTRAVRKEARRMRREDFVRNLRGIDAGADPDREMLEGIYDRIRRQEFRVGCDHVTQVAKLEQSFTNCGRRWQTLAERHRRLVCFCKLTEVPDVAKRRDRKKPNRHQRGVFLFNDLMVVTKVVLGGKRGTQHQHRFRISLSEVRVSVFSTADYPWGIQLQQRGRDMSRVLGTFDARTQNDQQRFVADLQESVAETLEMEKAKMFLNDLQDIRGAFTKFSSDERSLTLAPESFC